MAVNGDAQTVHVHRLPQSKYIDEVRWIPALSAFDRYFAAAVFDFDSDASAIEIHSLDQSNPANPILQSSWSSPSRISSLRVSQVFQKPLVAACTLAGRLHVLFPDAVDGSIRSEVTVPDDSLHHGAISFCDVQESASEFVTVGEDGRVNLVSIGNSRSSHRCIFDCDGLASFTAVKWASPTEFATGGVGFGLQWWDLRERPGGPASEFKANWSVGTTSGIVHSIDIHPSRKHTCLAGGSSGTVFAWDLRWPQQPVILSAATAVEMENSSPAESEVWEVHFDGYMRSLNIGNNSSRILPVMICSEDGILAVIEEGQEPVELLAEPCAINSFDIDRQNPADVVCSLEWESIAILARP
ncbi:nuclear pore complex protein NUP43 [Diospyros lotus]|uniref:nuclear pore complex protein NUP43 n=1 Tax=Diospyros lotus TaxID=55363 RepID=UPI00224D2F1A|nr:nuclear pore complex protein NUP43 [Diospyros lotus]